MSSFTTPSSFSFTALNGLKSCYFKCRFNLGAANKSYMVSGQTDKLDNTDFYTWIENFSQASNPYVFCLRYSLSIPTGSAIARIVKPLERIRLPIFSISLSVFDVEERLGRALFSTPSWSS